MPSLRIVMFPHPATEFNPELPRNSLARSACGWNLGDHCRRLLLSEGEYVDAQGRLRTGRIAFWGEWEANTLVTALPSTASPTDAKWVHEPQYPTPCPNRTAVRGECDGGCCMNTDPCVFGASFKYALCRQFRKIQRQLVPTVMQELAPDSLIVFCNRKNFQFYLDTVFVVGASARYTGPDRANVVRCSQAYRILTLDQTRGNLMFYRSVTFAEGMDGIYSFVPGCVEAANVGPGAISTHSRARCPLDFKPLNKIIGNTVQPPVFNIKNVRSFRSIEADRVLIRDVWKELLRQTRQGFVPAVHFDWP